MMDYSDQNERGTVHAHGKHDVVEASGFGFIAEHDRDLPGEKALIMDSCESCRPQSNWLQLRLVLFCAVWVDCFGSHGGFR